MDLLDLDAQVIEVGDECDHRRLIGDVQHDTAAATVDRGFTDELRQPFVERSLHMAVDLNVEAHVTSKLMSHLIAEGKQMLPRPVHPSRVNTIGCPDSGLLCGGGHGQ